jgi:phosphoglycolate phosphatase-like HAD superfamily hydrolase
MKLLLFDIDGTLLDSGGAGTRALALAFEERFSITDAFAGITMAGKTDLQILREGLVKHGFTDDERTLGALCRGYREHLRIQIENPRRHLKPMIEESLSLFAAMDEVSLGLLTGNIEAGARIKLDAFGLNRYFPFGAFGDDDEDRNRLLPVAVKRFRTLHRREIGYRDCVVIGDTPRDVECAKIHGACAVAVATGPYSYASLSASGADHVLRDMSEMDFAAVLTRCTEAQGQESREG